MPTLRDQAHKAAIDSVQAEKPSQFTIGAHYDGQTVTGGLSFDRTWTNGWGATAYLRAWWKDQAVIPRDKKGVVVGVDGAYKF